MLAFLFYKCQGLLRWVWRQTASSLSWGQISTCRVEIINSKICCAIIVAALWNRAGHYIFALRFLLLSVFFFSLPNLSRWRLDVYHISTHGVALVQIYSRMQV